MKPKAKYFKMAAPDNTNSSAIASGGLFGDNEQSPKHRVSGKPSLHRDFIAAIRNHDLWAYLAWQDIRLRYRRSKIGPLWITLSMAIFCASLGVVYSQLFKISIDEYLPFLATGFVFWGLMSGLLGELPNLYVENAGYITDIKVNPISVLLRMVSRHLITLSHNLIIIVAIYLYFGINPGSSILWLLPGIALVTANLIALGVILSIFGVRFRDVAPITQALIQVIFFITPITWFPRLLSAGNWVIALNPFAYYLDLLRSPVLGTAPSELAWITALGTFVLFYTVASIFYREKSARIPFWV